MKIYTLPCLLFSLLISIDIEAQVTVQGVLHLGDTSQVLMLETKKGDRFLGSINSWSRDSMEFRLATGDLLRYHLSAVERVAVQDLKSFGPGGDYSKGQFIVRSSDGIVREGQLKSLNQQGTQVKYKRNRRAYIRTPNLVEIVFDESGYSPNFKNYYRLRRQNGQPVFGQLLRLDEQSVIFQPEGYSPVRFDRSDVISLYQKQGLQAVTGHERALLVTPTGFNLKKGESEFRNINYIMANSFSTGFSDNVSGTVGLFGVIPYLQLKASVSISPLLNVSVGGGISLPGAVGWYMAGSLGTPDQFLNFGYMQNKGETIFDETDMDAVFFGGSYRVGNRSRLIGEFTHIVERRALFDANGFGTNTFALAYGWFSKRASLNLGLILAERTDFDLFCFGPFGPIPCSDEEQYHFAPIPVISTSVFFGRNED